MNNLTSANPLRWLTLVLLILTSVACDRPSTLTESVHEQIPISSRQRITLDVDRSVIDLASAPAGDLFFDAQIFSRNSAHITIERSGEGVHISYTKNSGWEIFPVKPAEIALRIPLHVPVEIDAFDGEITIHDYQGTLQATTVTGNIDARDFSGEIILISPRGNIHVRDGQGELRVLGEHGLLMIENVHGKVGSATIMGGIHFSGNPERGDEIRLEADHGSISINLARDANLTVLARSNSGNVICLVPGITQDGRRCQGRLGDGGGTLWVRTVSGDINIQEIPEFD